MSIKNLDEATLAKLNECKTKEETLDVARELNLDLTDEELDQVCGGLTMRSSTTMQSNRYNTKTSLLLDTLQNTLQENTGKSKQAKHRRPPV